MKRKKIVTDLDNIPVSSGPSLPSQKVSKVQKVKIDQGDVAEIKRKMSKVNLYLTLLNKSFFETVPIADVDTAAEIENEINDFIISRAKSVFSSNEGIAGLSHSEWAFLKLLSKKGTEISPQVSKPEKDETELSLRHSVQPVAVQQTPERPKQGSKPNTLKRTVSIIGEDGNPKEVEVETDKMVLPPPTLRRKPPATFEQQLARAAADTAAMTQAMGAGGPMVVEAGNSDY